jgi:hypothetical protein
MYIRFITQFENEYGEIETGVFHAAAFVRGNPDTFDYDVKSLESIKNWFNCNLEAPTKFSRSKKKYAEGISLSWFKNSAKEHIQRMYDIKSILEKYDILVEIINHDRPGTIIYQDEYQVSAIPFRLDKNRVL